MLELVFAKKGWAISRDLIDEVIHCQPESAARLIELIYSILTKREVEQPMPLEDEDYTPPFARPTASLLVKERLREPSLQDKDEFSMTTVRAPC
jgi:hypothetical protein